MFPAPCSFDCINFLHKDKTIEEKQNRQENPIREVKTFAMEKPQSKPGISAYTNPNAVTIDGMRGIASRSIGAGMRDTLRRCQKCSRNGRRCTTSDHPCAGTSHRADTECAAPMARGPSLLRSQDPDRWTIGSGRSKAGMWRLSSEMADDRHNNTISDRRF